MCAPEPHPKGISMKIAPTLLVLMTSACAVSIRIQAQPKQAQRAQPKRAQRAQPKAVISTVQKTVAHPNGLARRWVYIARNLLVDEGLQEAQKTMKDAAALGYNGVVLADYKLNVLDRVSPHYFENLNAFKNTARELGLKIYPTVCPMGYSNGLLAHDPNLAEGLPVRDAPFVVKNGRADLEQSDQKLLPGGDFEEAQGDNFAGWNFQDASGKGSFADAQEHHGGARSLRFENIGAANPESGNGRVMRTIATAPWRQYHLSLWIRTQDFATPGSVRAVALSPAGRSLLHIQWNIQKTQDWTRYDAIFNSLDNAKVSVYMGVWGARDGKLWFDDAQLEEVGLLNVLRRDGCPLSVRGEDGTQYREGRDFLPVRDEKLGNVPWDGEYETWHASPSIVLSPDSRIKEGQKLRVSFHHIVTIYGGQVAACLSEPKVYALMRDQIERVQKALQPDGWFMSHDEIRVANWCETCEKRHLTPGQLLADNVKRCTAMIRAVSPKSDIAVWSDMFDPFHNAVDDYYLVNGSWKGAWEGLGKEVTIANWNLDKLDKSLPFFSRLGHKQIIAGYYDADPAKITSQLQTAKASKNVDGVLYTTWSNRYEDMAAFAKAAWGSVPTTK